MTTITFRDSKGRIYPFYSGHLDLQKAIDEATGNFHKDYRGFARGRITVAEVNGKPWQQGTPAAKQKELFV